jgi:ribosomal protein L7/L12
MEVNNILIKRLRYDTGCGLYDAKCCLEDANTYTEAVELAKIKVYKKKLICRKLVLDQ